MEPHAPLMALLMLLSRHLLPCVGGRLEASRPVGDEHSGLAVMNVDHFGAFGDSIHDDRKAFRAAWKAACSSPAPAVLLVPKNKHYRLTPLVFSGPCKSSITVLIKGTIEAPLNCSVWAGSRNRQWISFQGIRNIVVHGGGALDGNGHVWWKHSCKVNRTLPCITAPTALTFYSCKGLTLQNLKIRNSPQIHVSIEKCEQVHVSNIAIVSPEKSPNTDGIHVTRSKNVQIVGCSIQTGDDCISIVTGAQRIKVSNIFCGPGHGISIGSLGAHNSKAYVADVIVDTVTMNGTTNGVRIKSWQGGYGQAGNMVFQNIAMHNVANPIIIDQEYCDSKDPCKEQASAVKVEDVLYKNIRGTSASEVAVTLHCSRNVPCRRIMFEEINLVGMNGKATKGICKNAKWQKKGNVSPVCI